MIHFQFYIELETLIQELDIHKNVDLIMERITNLKIEIPFVLSRINLYSKKAKNLVNYRNLLFRLYEHYHFPIYNNYIDKNLLVLLYMKYKIPYIKSYFSGPNSEMPEIDQEEKYLYRKGKKIWKYYIINDDYESLKKMTDFDINLNSDKEDKNTPIEFACKWSSFKCFLYLKLKGAKVTDTCYYYAVESGNQRLVNEVSKTVERHDKWSMNAAISSLNFNFFKNFMDNYKVKQNGNKFQNIEDLAYSGEFDTSLPIFLYLYSFYFKYAIKPLSYNVTSFRLPYLLDFLLEEIRKAGKTNRDFAKYNVNSFQYLKEEGTILRQAVLTCDLEYVKHVIKIGYKLQDKDKDLVLYAATTDNVEIVDYLITNLKLSPLVFGEDNGCALHYAVYTSSFKVVKQLIEKYKVPANISNESNKNALFSASYLPIAEYLISKGCDANEYNIVFLIYASGTSKNIKVANYFMRLYSQITARNFPNADETTFGN